MQIWSSPARLLKHQMWLKSVREKEQGLCDVNSPTLAGKTQSPLRKGRARSSFSLLLPGAPPPTRRLKEAERAPLTCSKVSCLEMVSFSNFLIFFISLLTWNSCSCSRCCSSSAFSCCSWNGKAGRGQ